MRRNSGVNRLSDPLSDFPSVRPRGIAGVGLRVLTPLQRLQKSNQRLLVIRWQLQSELMPLDRPGGE
jgi:hypothetical protein